MPQIRLIRAVPKPVCGAYSNNTDNAMECELPPDHFVAGWDFHLGRDRLGRWRSWNRRIKWVIDVDEIA